MKTINLLIILSFFTLKVLSQPFGANGAQWHFTEWWPWNMPPQAPSMLLTSTPDTINGISCYRIYAPSSPCSWINNYVYQSNDTVYYWVQATNSFKMLYNYSASAGDTLTITSDFGQLDSAQFLVDSAGTVLINGLTKRIYYFHIISTIPHYFDFYGPVIEDIGCISYLFPQSGVCDPQRNGLRCFEDSVLGLYQVSNCTATFYVGLDEISGRDGSLSIKPNPVNEACEIEAPGFDNSTLLIYDVTGRVVIEEAFNRRKTLQIPAFKKGVYIVEIVNSVSHRVRAKMVKQ